MSRAQTIEATVLGGFPVLVTFYDCPAEPDVGFPSPYAELEGITLTTGKPAPFIEKQMGKGDWDSLQEAADLYLEGSDEDYRY